MRLALSFVSYALAIGLWIRAFLLFSRLSAHRATPLAPGEKLHVLRARPGEFTAEGERIRRQLRIAAGAALGFQVLAILL